MTAKAEAPAITLDALGEEDVARLIAQLKAKEAAEKDAENATRDAQKAVVEPAVLTLVKGFAPRDFKPKDDGSFNTGWQVPVSVEVEVGGTKRKVTGQLLLTIKK